MAKPWKFKKTNWIGSISPQEKLSLKGHLFCGISKGEGQPKYFWYPLMGPNFLGPSAPSCWITYLPPVQRNTTNFKFQIKQLIQCYASKNAKKKGITNIVFIHIIVSAIVLIEKYTQGTIWKKKTWLTNENREQWKIHH